MLRPATAGVRPWPCATLSISPTWSATPRWCGSGGSPPGSRLRCSPRSSTSTPAAASRTASRCGWSTPPRRRAAAARRHDRRADLGQHRRRPRHRRPAQGYHCIFVCPTRSARRRATCSRRTAPRSWSARPRSPEDPRLLLLGRRPARPRDAGRVGSPTSTPTRPTRSRTTRPPGPRSGRRPTAGSRTSSPASAPAARSAASAATSRRSPTAAVQIIGADPEGSVYSGGTGRPYLVEGVGEDFWPTDLRPARRRPRSSRSATPTRSRMTRRLAREEGLLVGGSCGMAVRRRARGRAGARPRTPSSSCCCPTPAAATCKIFNDELDGRLRLPAAATGATVGDVLAAQGRRDARPRARAPERDRRATRSTSCASYGVSQMPVRPRGAAGRGGEVVGAVDELDAARRAVHGTRAARPTGRASTCGRRCR